jgi:hypothetical protein
MIDPRAPRFGAILSVLLLTGAFLADAPVIVLAVALMLGACAAFGTQYSLLGRPWPIVRRALRLGPPAELEPEWGPRFAQTLAFVILAVALVLFVGGAGPLAWLPVGFLAALQVLLAITGFCVGCRLYVARWYLPSLWDRLVGKSRPDFGPRF